MYVAYRESLKAESANDEEIVVEPVTPDVSVNHQDEHLPDHPPLDLYTEPILRGG
jgi:hypothetical protein